MKTVSVLSVFPIGGPNPCESAPAPRGTTVRRSAAAARSSFRHARRSATFRFSGRAFPKLARIVRELRAVAGHCRKQLAAFVAVTVADIRGRAGRAEVK